MITDIQTNKLFLADTLPKQQPKFFHRFEKVLNEFDIHFDFIQNTRDIWAVDFMPIQIDNGNFTQFIYDPDYLYWYNLEHTITDTSAVPEAQKVAPKQSILKVEGGNVIKGTKKIIMCDKVLKDNITFKMSQQRIIDELITAFQVQEIIFIPTHPDDFIGHADGMIRFIDDNNVVINSLKNENNKFKSELLSVLKENKLNYLEIPFNISNCNDDWDARGIYINYLQMKDVIFVPQFNFKEDKLAEHFLSETFPKSKIVPILCNEIAREGGILNCITWNIQTK